MCVWARGWEREYVKENGKDRQKDRKRMRMNSCALIQKKTELRKTIKT